MTLDDFFLPRPPELGERLTLALEDGAALEPLGKTLSPRVVTLLKMLSNTVEEHIHGLLQVDLFDVLAGAWNKTREINKELEKSAATPGKDFFAHLAEHRVSSTHEPSLELLVGRKKVARLPFPVSLELVLRGAVLTIRDGAIREVRTGQILGKGVVKCGKAVLMEREFKALEVPGKLLRKAN
jgi:hypothetical protein